MLSLRIRWPVVLLIMSFATLLYRSSLSRPLGVGILAHSLFMSSQSNKAVCEPLAASLDLKKNPLLKKDSMPLFKEIQPVHIVPALENDLSALKEQFKNFEKDLNDKLHYGEIPLTNVVMTEQRLQDILKPKKFPGSLTYGNVVEELERIQAPLSYSWGVVGHLMGVKNSDDLRKAHDAMQPEIIKAYQEIGQSKDLYDALRRIANDESIWFTIEEAQQRILRNSLRDMKASGVALVGEKREAFNKLQLEAAELSTKFSNHVLDSTKAFKLRLTTPEEVEGLPASAKALAAQSAVANGDKDATAEAGPWVITLDGPSYLPVMKYLKDRSIREKVYRAFLTRASEGELDNAPLIQRILQIKTEQAQLLGYPCYAEKSLASKMAPNVETVMNLIEMLREKSYPAAMKEVDEVRAFAKAAGCEDALALWDIPFWSERLRESEYEFEEEQLRPYFSLPVVLDGMFALANRLFGVTIVRADGQAQVWHEDVMFFNILDESGQHIASFFLDAYSRPAEKRGGAWMDTCLGRSKVLNRRPVAYLTCNGSPPVGDKPSQMTFREVETLFHEFGHGLQHMLTKVEHGDAAGINNVEWDAVELPSQFMENWCYDKKTLYSFAKHYQTGEPLPLELFNKIHAAKNFQAGMQMMRQLYFGAMDMYLHSRNYDANGSKTVFDVQHELSNKYTLIPPLPEDRFLCAFSHIFSGGYSAGYYSYKWAEVMSADAFAAFEEAGLDDEEAVRATGRRFRDTVLAMGGGKHPSEVFKAFRGRDPQPEALLRHSGLI